MRAAIVLLVLMPGIAMAQTPALQLQKSTSSSGQFIIYHTDATLRGRLTRKVEDIKLDWLKGLHLTDDWEHPIIVQIPTLRPRTPLRLNTNLFEGDGGALKVQVDVYDLTALTTPEFEREIFRALTLEYAYRNVPLKAGKVVQQPPDWLLDALAEQVAASKDGINTDIYVHLTQNASPPKLEAFLKQDTGRMDATSRAIFRAQSMGLLLALMEQPDGAKHLASYLKALPYSSPSNAKTLLEQFPGLTGDPGMLSKVWTLSLAKASASNRIMPISVEETEKRLATILEVTAPPNPKKPDEVRQSGAAAFPDIARSETGKYVLRQKQEELMNLEIRAHPFYKPIIEEYRLIATELTQKPKRNLEKRILKNNELRTLVLKRCNEITDYVNWFEATQMNLSSDSFEKVLKLGKSSTTETERSDTISRYLDKVERQGW